MFFMNNLMWFWLAIMVVCIVIEAVTFALATVWGAISALVMIFVSRTNMPLKWQLVLFLVLTIVLVLTTRPFAMKKHDERKFLGRSGSSCYKKNLQV